MSKILIVSHHYYPEKNPRAFRSLELVQGFLKRGHTVRLIIPEGLGTESSNHDNKSLTIDYVKKGFLLNKPAGTPSGDMIPKKGIRLKMKIRKLIHFFSFYLFGGREMEFYFPLKKKFIELDDHFDMAISIGLPLSVHMGLSYILKRNRSFAKVALADYGDPFSYSKQYKVAPYFKWIEKRLLKRFQYIVIPTEKSIESYQYFKPQEQIKIIPQGFDFSKVRISNYTKNKVPTFGYAGAFYKKIRDPMFFFEYLLKLDVDFKFVIYTYTDRLNNIICYNEYIDSLGGKLEIRSLIPRIDCIFELSKFDFLVNFENVNTNQEPSKLVDYMLTKRPVLSFNEEKFNESVFQEFLRYDFSGKLDVDISKFNISEVISQFEGMLC